MATIVRLPTWTCPDCGYQQDYEPTAMNHADHFSKLGLKDGDCPACEQELTGAGMAGTTPLAIQTDPARMMAVTILNEAEVLNAVDAKSDGAVESFYHLLASQAVQAEEDAGANSLSDGERQRRIRAWLSAKSAEIGSAKAQRRAERAAELDAEKARLLAQRTRDLEAMRLLEYRTDKAYRVFTRAPRSGPALVQPAPPPGSIMARMVGTLDRHSTHVMPWLHRVTGR